MGAAFATTVGQVAKTGSKLIKQAKFLGIPSELDADMINVVGTSLSKLFMV